MAELDPAVVAHVADLARAAKGASRRLALLTRADKDAALLAIADALDGAIPVVVAANAEDLDRGRERGMAAGLLDRLMLDEAR
ncbi:MAG: gamma-glutamyl-phosphate reductase, partial [Dermatophilaceae bacterium]|nr:gamma-glutamyl-phosphate reductase [Dermatophilaceae bacterium]